MEIIPRDSWMFNTNFCPIQWRLSNWWGFKYTDLQICIKKMKVEQEKGVEILQGPMNIVFTCIFLKRVHEKNWDVLEGWA